jgi:hypothetical protein
VSSDLAGWKLDLDDPRAPSQARLAEALAELERLRKP